MVITSRENVLGAWAYTVGVIIAVAVGVIVGLRLDVPNFKIYSLAASALLVFFGLLIGFLNVNTRDINAFLLAGVSLVLVNSLASQAVSQGVVATGAVGSVLHAVFNSLLLIFVPATVIVALKSLFSITRM
jgi:hypothetical protein